jgi:hypothetical protein
MRSREGTAVGRLREQLDRSLFPQAPADTLRFRGWEGVVVLLAFIAMAAALQFLRAGPTDSAKALFAEDGPVYLGGAITHGFFDSLASPYAEYLVVIPRLLGELATIGPLRYAPETMNVGAALLVAVSALAVWVGAAGLIRNIYLRVVLVALVLVPPVSGLETVISATNVAWYAGFAVFWLLLWRPDADWSAALGALLILITGLSSPTIFFFVPLAVLRAIAVRDRRDALLVGAFALALAIQLPVTAFGSEHVTDPEWTANIFTTFLQRVPLGVALGLELGGGAWEEWGWGALIAAGVGVGAALAALALRATAGRLFALVAVATAVVMFFGSSYTRGLGDEMVWPQNLFTAFGGRYAMIPVLLIASAAIVLADSRLRGPKPSRWPAVALAVVLVVALVTSFGGDANREMPSWANSLRDGAVACRATRAADATIFITPEGWTMTVPCERLESEYAATPSG